MIQTSQSGQPDYTLDCQGEQCGSFKVTWAGQLLQQPPSTSGNAYLTKLHKLRDMKRGGVEEHEKSRAASKLTDSLAELAAKVQTDALASVAFQAFMREQIEDEMKKQAPNWQRLISQGQARNTGNPKYQEYSALLKRTFEIENKIRRHSLPSDAAELLTRMAELEDLGKWVALQMI